LKGTTPYHSAIGLTLERYHSAIGLTHWSFAGFQSVVTLEGTAGSHTVGMVSVMPNAGSGSTDGAYNRVVELMPNGSLRPIYSLDEHAVSTGKPPFARPELHPDGSLRFADSRNRNFTAIWRSPFDAAAVNWTTWSVIANLSNAAPNPPRHGGGQGQTHPLMDVDLPVTGPFAAHADGGVRVAKKLVLTLDANNNQNYSRFHLGSAEWNPNAANGAHGLSPSEWKWTAMPGGAWNATSCNVTMETVGT
jgi:hypothetical protein